MREGNIINVGLIGFGRHTERSMFCNIIANNYTRIVAVADIDKQRLELAGRKLLGVNLFNSGKELIEAAKQVQLDAVFISLTPQLHYELTKMALLNNLHVLVEKPVCLKADEFGELIELAETRKLVVGVDTKWRYTKVTGLVQKWVSEDERRKPVMYNLNVTYPNVLNEKMWGLSSVLEVSLYDMFVHAFDYMKSWMGDYEIYSPQYYEGRNKEIYLTSILRNENSFAVINLIQGSEEYCVDLDVHMENRGKIHIHNLTEVDIIDSKSWLGTEGSLRDESKLHWNQGRLYRGYARAGYAEIWKEFIDAINISGKMKTDLRTAQFGAKQMEFVLENITKIL